MRVSHFAPVLFGLAVALGGRVGFAQSEPSPTQVLQAQAKSQQEQANSQQRVDALNRDALSMVEEYRATQEALLPLRAQNAKLEALVHEQAQELLSLQTQVGQVAKVHHDLRPLLLRMVDALDTFVGLDLPFLPQERKTRSRALHEMLDSQRPGALPETTRRIFEAYMVELSYGRTLQAYEDKIELDGQVTAVEMLRLGRVGLFYLSLDGERAGRFDPQTKRFEPLRGQDVQRIRTAVQVAKKRIPPQLIDLPVAKTPSRKGVRS